MTSTPSNAPADFWSSLSLSPKTLSALSLLAGATLGIAAYEGLLSTMFGGGRRSCAAATNSSADTPSDPMKFLSSNQSNDSKTMAAKTHKRPVGGISNGVLEAIGSTPLIYLRSLSEQTGCVILGKAEFLNPGGSVKDRVALRIVQEALHSGKLPSGGMVTEGTVGSTGVSLSLVCAALGLQCHVCMPDDAAIEKSQLLQAYGAHVERLRPVSIAHPMHFVNVARRRAQEASGGGVFADQFENLANFHAHYDTAEEIWLQCSGKIDAFICGAGTGGTLAGVSRYLKEKSGGKTLCYLADPPGSSLYNRVVRGVTYTKEEAEGKRLRNPFDTIVEGVGLNRLTQNFAQAQVDGAIRVTDREMTEMAAYLLRNEGLFLGSSAAMNAVAAVKLARMVGPGKVVVTILCDGGHRHLSKFHNVRYLEEFGLTPTSTGKTLDFVGKPNAFQAPGLYKTSRAMKTEEFE